jgi:hypothetical protein
MNSPLETREVRLRGLVHDVSEPGHLTNHIDPPAWTSARHTDTW